MNPLQKARHAFLVNLVRDRHGGSAARFARIMKWEGPGLAQRYLHPGRKDGRMIGDRLAREIERMHGLASGTMDVVARDDSGTVRVAGKELHGLEAQLIALYRDLTADGRDALLGSAQRIHLREHAAEYSIANPFASASAGGHPQDLTLSP